MKLSVWAKLQGVTRQTAYRWFRTGKLPVPAEQLPTGTIIVHPNLDISKSFVVYARVSSSDQKSNLDSQVSRICEEAAKRGLVISEIIKEVGSGLNGKRPGLIRALSKTSSGIMVEHRDRLCRFGFEYLEASMKQSGRSIVVVDPSEIEDDIVRDLHDIIMSLCARLYGKRAAKNKAKRAIEAVQKND